MKEASIVVAPQDVEMEDLETDMRSEEGRSCVKTRVRRAPEVRERERAQSRPSTTEQEIVRNGVEEAG